MTPEKSRKQWHAEADVVVVGYGAAGAATSITAHDAGAKILILEKAPRGEEGGNSRASGQGWFNPMPVDRAMTYLRSLCGAHAVPEEVVRAWAEEMGKNTAWVSSLGGKPVEWPPTPDPAEFRELPGADCVHMYNLEGGLGHSRLWGLFKGAVENRRIEVRYATAAKELLPNCPADEILGIRAEHEGKSFNIKARKAVVLTCGGFENSQQMVRDFAPGLAYGYPLGTPHNTGDGIRMAMAVGADLWHMNNVSGPWYALKVPDIPSALELVALHFRKEFPGGMILVGPDGKRFTDEKLAKHGHGKRKIGGQWVQAPGPCPMFMIFDHLLFSAGPLYDKNLYHGWNQILKVYDWSDDNSVELTKGWIKKADTIGELARKVGLDATSLEDTVSKWNGHVAAGKGDPEFGRMRMLTPIATPPFYAVEVSPAIINTQGGPRRNARGQIVRPDGSPIKRLYSAGEMGSVYSFLYQGGGNIGECMAFGRISGRNAAAEKAWE